MKKHVFLIALACLTALASCNKNKESQGAAQFTATIEHQGGRTSLDPNNGQINWTAGDQIVIGNDNGETAVFTLQSGEGTTEGGFGTSDEFNTVGPFIAAYPSDAEIENDKVTFNLPATQTIGETGTFANGANPMVACSDDKNLQFKNLCGGVGIRLKGVGAHVSAVRITSKNTSEKLWGAYEVSNCAADEPTLTVASNNQGTNVITLNCDVTLTTAAKTFFVMLPPGTLANGFTMEVLDGNEVLATKETTSDIALVERNSVKCFNEILIDVEFDGNVEIPTGMSNADIIVTNYIEDAIPDETGDFAVGYSKMLMATNAANDEIIYMSILSVDDDIRKGQRQLQNYELSAKETAITLALNMFPYGMLQSKDETFASIKDVLYSLDCVQSLKISIESVVSQYGYLKIDELSPQLIAVSNFFKNELFPESKGNGYGEMPVIGTIELKKDGSTKLNPPSLPISRYRGIRIDLESANFNESTNTWSLNLTAYSDNGIYVGLNKGYIAQNGYAYVSQEEKTHYFIPPMNAGKFEGIFLSWSGLKDYFNDTKRLFTEEGFFFDDMTWDKAKLENIRIDIGASDNALALLSPWDDTRTAIVNAVYTVLGGINSWVTTDGIMDYFMELFIDDDFVQLFINNWNNGMEGFTVVANRICETFEDFLFEQTLNLPGNIAEIPENLKGKVAVIEKALSKLVSMINLGAFTVGTAASFNLFESFALEIDAEFNSEPVVLPTLTTDSFEVFSGSGSQATVTGTLVNAGTYGIVERGICYGFSPNPTINDICVPADGTGLGSFTCTLNLQSNSPYYARAYAKTWVEPFVGYSSNEVSFTTTLPSVTTHEVLPTNIGDTWATVTGSVFFPDLSQPIEYGRGFVIGDSPNGLTVFGENEVVSYNGTELLNFSYTFNDLWPNTTYYVRAYSYAEGNGVVYGDVVSFTTGNSGGQAPTGAINGLFTINANGDQVYFSQGNLQYIGSATTPYWKFADHQWDYLGDNGQGNNSQNIDRDLFGWGESGYNHGAVCYQPWQNSATGSDYYAYGSSSYNLYDMTMQADWGYNAISNGGNQENSGWRTLTGGSNGEWNYIFNLRSTSSNVRFAKAKVNGVNGVIILPDNWNSSNYVLNGPNDGSIAYDSNIISSETWNSIFELNGSVFLPAAGYRDNRWGNSVFWVQHSGAYWTATHGGADNCYDMFFEPTLIDPPGTGGRMTGESVRLVRNAE